MARADFLPLTMVGAGKSKWTQDPLALGSSGSQKTCQAGPLPVQHGGSELGHGGGEVRKGSWG